MRLQSTLWFVPALCVIAGAALSFATIAVDRSFDYEAIPPELVGDPEAVTAILSTVAASMVGLVTLVLTITMVVVQLAMGQFSPRIVQRILRDKPSQFAIGLFIATFVHALLAIREVTNAGDGTGQVPGVAVVTALVLVLVSIVVLVLYVHHIGQALRVSELIEIVGRETRSLIDRKYPSESEGTSRFDGRTIPALRSGVVTAIDDQQLIAEAERAGCRLELVPALGEFVPADAPLFHVSGDSARLDRDPLYVAVRLDEERTLDEDVAYGLRLLVDIAQRSLADSPFQDPTTSVQAIDRLHDILRQLAARPIHDGRHLGPSGELRLVVPAMSWDAYVHLAFDEIRMAGAGSPQVSRRLMAALEDLKTVALPDRQAALDEQVQALKQAAEARHEAGDDPAHGARSDPMGIGTRADNRERADRDVSAGHRRAPLPND